MNFEAIEDQDLRGWNPMHYVMDSAGYCNWSGELLGKMMEGLTANNSLLMRPHYTETVARPMAIMLEEIMLEENEVITIPVPHLQVRKLPKWTPQRAWTIP